RQAKVGLSQLSAVTGLHHATIKAMIQRAIGPGLSNAWEQPELPILAELTGPVPTQPTRTVRLQPTPPTPAYQPTPAMSL
ncbi:MAG: hypothetical protein LBO20_06400, partial [Bifidobacteriaceae bacterium]|nr:hypothetical protein [Bifidobacteriaceae bacterium]